MCSVFGAPMLSVWRCGLSHNAWYQAAGRVGECLNNPHHPHPRLLSRTGKKAVRPHKPAIARGGRVGLRSISAKLPQWHPRMA